MVLYFLRHGQSEANAAGQLGGRLDAPLTEQGVAQAEAAVESVKQLNPDIIYCSPLKRARKTAEIVAGKAGFSDRLYVDDRLIERGVGVLEGQDDKGGKLLVSTTPDDVEGAESIADMRARTQDFLDEVNTKHPDDVVLVVGHGAHIKMMIALTTDRTWEDVRGHKLPNGVPFQDMKDVI